MNDTALFAVLLAAVAGVLAGRAWASGLRRSEVRERPTYRTSPHYVQGLHYLAAGKVELAISELTKVTRENGDAVEVQQVLGNLLRETGQVERAIQVHQGLLARKDLSRAERAYVLACLGTDHRKAGFLDRATAAFEEVLELDPRSIHALTELQKLHEDQRHWGEAYHAHTRVSRLRKTDDSLVLGYLQAEIGQEAARAGRREEAERAFRTALSLDRRVFPAHLGLADLYAETDAARAASVLEEAMRAVPERAYLAFDRLAKAWAASGQPSRFIALCEEMVRQDPRDWRARVALARHLSSAGQHEEAFGLLQRALESNPQAVLVHIEVWRTLKAMARLDPATARYFATAEEATFYRDPHVCTACRYRADDMLWRCPHCHEWGSFVEERLVPAAGLR